MFPQTQLTPFLVQVKKKSTDMKIEIVMSFSVRKMEVTVLTFKK